MKNITGPIWATTATVAQVSGTTTQTVRRALALGVVEAIKCGGIWRFDLYAALVLTIALALKDSGLRWRKVPVALARARYAFPKGIREWERRVVLSAKGPERLRNFLLFTGWDACVVVKHRFSNGGSRLEIASSRDLPHLPAFRSVTIISIKASYARLLKAGNGSLAQNPAVPAPDLFPEEDC